MTAPPSSSGAVHLALGHARAELIARPAQPGGSGRIFHWLWATRAGPRPAPRVIHISGIGRAVKKCTDFKFYSGREIILRTPQTQVSGD